MGCLVIDGGDFSMGTLIQTVFETQAAELRMLGYLGCDVTTFRQPRGSTTAQGACQYADQRPQALGCCPSHGGLLRGLGRMEAAGLTEGQQQLKDAFAAYGVATTPWWRRAMWALPWWVFSARTHFLRPTCELI